MRLIVVGGRSLAVAVTKRLLDDGHDIPAVWTREGDDLEVFAHQLDLPALITPDADMVWDLEVDALLSVHNHAFLGREFRDATRFGAWGLHPSLLPRHRGRDAVRWTVHMGDPIAGTTVYEMDDGADTGPILSQDWCHVRPDDDASALWRRELFPRSVELLARTCGLGDTVIAHGGKIPSREQDEAVATWEPAFQSAPLAEVAIGEVGADG